MGSFNQHSHRTPISPQPGQTNDPSIGSNSKMKLGHMPPEAHCTYAPLGESLPRTGFCGEHGPPQIHRQPQRPAPVNNPPTPEAVGSRQDSWRRFLAPGSGTSRAIIPAWKAETRRALFTLPSPLASRLALGRQKEVRRKRGVNVRGWDALEGSEIPNVMTLNRLQSKYGFLCYRGRAVHLSQDNACVATSKERFYYSKGVPHIMTFILSYSVLFRKVLLFHHLKKPFLGWPFCEILSTSSI
ncbi:uncharacterized protein LOC142008242 [Carettochelys insculpta]|uniref:uncharacterized protein LOC142008242 n=1 Tax=Carettochelys insculpta TaxID=44489 RepID=UPI003EBB940A